MPISVGAYDGAVLTHMAAPGQALHRAYSKLEVKSVDDDQRVITGIATSATPDRYGDVVEPDGAEFKLPIPFLWQHDSRSPIGWVTRAKQVRDTIEVVVKFAKTDREGALKQRLDDAWESVKIGLVRGLSIGFRSLEESYDKVTGGYNFLRWEWVELSAVTIPANTDADIQTIKSFDRKTAAPGMVVRSLQPGATGGSSTQRNTTMKKSYADQIAGWQATRTEKAERMDVIMDASAESGVTLDAAQKEEHDTLQREVDEIDAQVVRLKQAETRAKQTAQPARGETALAAHESRGVPFQVSVNKTLPPGILFARYAMCMGMARGNEFEARELAKVHYGDDAAPLLKMIEFVQRSGGEFFQRAAVGSLNAQTASAGSELVPYNIMDDFIQFLRPRTILGKFGANGIPALKLVPFNTRVSGFSGGTTANWVGEGLPILLSRAASLTVSLTWSKLGALTVLTKEEIRFSNPNAEQKVRDDIASAIVQKQDKDFVDPAKAAVANVSPASVTYQTTPVLTTGTTSAAFRTDLATLIATFATLNFDPSDIVLIMSTGQALQLSLMITSLGVPVFPDITMDGGRIAGFPVITTNQMVTIGSPLSEIIVAVKASEIYLADDGSVTVDASDQASVEMVDASSQSGITGTGASLVSFWQAGLVGLKATRAINWKLRRTGAARYLYNVAYKA